MPHVEVNGQELFYEERGAGDAIVFSHGFLMDRTMFAAQVEALSGSWRTIAWDERGHGLTRSTAEPFSYWDSASDLLGLLDALGVERAVLVGMSQGGFLSLRAALSAPERVRALILLDSQAGTEDPAKAPYYDQLIDSWEADGLSDELGAIVASIVIGSDAALSTPWIERWRGIDTAVLRQIYATLMTRDDITERVREIAAPTLVVHGEADVAIDPARAHALTDLMPNATLQTIPGAGHAANLTHPAPVNAAIERFLAAL